MPISIENKRRDMLTSRSVLIHGNARHLSADAAQLLLEQFQWDIFDHPPCNVDIVPCDFHLYAEMKKWLEGKRFQTGDELQGKGKIQWESLAATSYEEGRVKLVHRYDQFPQSPRRFCRKDTTNVLKIYL